MPLQKGQSGNPKGRAVETLKKPFKTALEMEIAAAKDHKALRRVARGLLKKAEGGDVQAIREVADRLDGKVATTIAGDEDRPVEHVHTVKLVAG